MEEEEKNPTTKNADVPVPPEKRSGREHRIRLRVAIPVLCLALVAAVLLTWTFTSLAAQKKRLDELDSQKKLYESLIEENRNPTGDALAVLKAMLRHYSLYADTLDEKAMAEAAFKAYVAATGDAYARYYTEEEFAEVISEGNGDFCGVGITVVQSSFSYDGSPKKVYRVIEVYEDSPALEAGVRSGDMVYAIKVDGVWKTIGELEFDNALIAMRGEAGTLVDVRILRETDGVTEVLERTMERRKMETHSVRSEILQENSRVGVVRITGFDMTTPGQFKSNVNSLLDAGVEHFVFDVRNNPGGDLKSITAVMSYFLNEGDVVLKAINKDKETDETYTVGTCAYTGRYEGCSVTAEEIGMYQNLDFTVLCNENTASAAEVFVATLRDYRDAEDEKDRKPFRSDNIVGTTTFGKGIMQLTVRVPFSDGTGAYLKLTTHEYVTKCEQSYHGTGIEPDLTVELSEEAKKQPLPALKYSEDAQLQAAVALFK